MSVYDPNVEVYEADLEFAQTFPSLYRRWMATKTEFLELGRHDVMRTMEQSVLNTCKLCRQGILTKQKAKARLQKHLAILDSLRRAVRKRRGIYI